MAVISKSSRGEAGVNLIVVEFSQACNETVTMRV